MNAAYVIAAAAAIEKCVCASETIVWIERSATLYRRMQVCLIPMERESAVYSVHDTWV